MGCHCLLVNSVPNSSLPRMHLGLPGVAIGKESACIAGDSVLTPGLGNTLEKGMATLSSILDWKIPWTEEPGRL